MSIEPKLANMTDRIQTIRAMPEPPAYVKQRIAQAAETLSRAGDLQICVELANEALTKFTAMNYTQDETGAYPNVVALTYRLKVAGPWGAAGWKYWGLRKWEAEVLRAVLRARAVDHTRPALYDFNAERRTWHLNLYDYPSPQAAQFYLERQAIKLAEWRTHHTAHQAAIARRVARKVAR